MGLRRVCVRDRVGALAGQERAIRRRKRAQRQGKRRNSASVPAQTGEGQHELGFAGGLVREPRVQRGNGVDAEAEVVRQMVVQRGVRQRQRRCERRGAVADVPVGHGDGVVRGCGRDPVDVGVRVDRDVESRVPRVRREGHLRQIQVRRVHRLHRAERVAEAHRPRTVRACGERYPGAERGTEK
eukprot:1508081-Pyramimonas_sp.AAC.1